MDGAGFLDSPSKVQSLALDQLRCNNISRASQLSIPQKIKYFTFKSAANHSIDLDASDIFQTLYLYYALNLQTMTLSVIGWGERWYVINLAREVVSMSTLTSRNRLQTLEISQWLFVGFSLYDMTSLEYDFIEDLPGFMHVLPSDLRVLIISCCGERLKNDLVELLTVRGESFRDLRLVKSCMVNASYLGVG